MECVGERPARLPANQFSHAGSWEKKGTRVHGQMFAIFHEYDIGALFTMIHILPTSGWPFGYW